MWKLHMVLPKLIGINLCSIESLIIVILPKSVPNKTFLKMRLPKSSLQIGTPVNFYYYVQIMKMWKIRELKLYYKETVIQ